MSSYILTSNEDGNIVLSKRSRKENESIENHNDEASSSMNNNTIVLPPSKRTKSDNNMIFENVTQTSSSTTTITTNKSSPTTEESVFITTTTPLESRLNNDNDKMDVDDISDENQNNHNIEKKQVDMKQDIHDINIVLDKDVTIQKQEEEEETSSTNKKNVLPQPKLTININNLDQTNTSNNHPISPHPVRIPTPRDTNITKEQNEISNLLLLASSTTTTTTTINKDEEENNDYDEQSSSTSTINTSKGPSNNTTISNKKKELIQTNLDKQFNVIKTKRRIKTTVYKMTSKNQENKQTTTDKDVMQLIGTITFPFTNILKITNDNNGGDDDDDDHTNNESPSTLHYPRVMQNEIYINSKSQANSVRVSEQGSLLELKKYRQQKFEAFSNKMKDFEKKKRDEQKKLLNERMLKVQNHASKLLVLKHGHDSIINNTSKDEQEKMAKSQEGKRQRYIYIYIIYLH